MPDDESGEVRAAREVLFLDQLKRARKALELARETADRIGSEGDLGRVQRALRALHGDDMKGTASFVLHRSDAEHAIKRAQSALHDARRLVQDTPGPFPAEALEELRTFIYTALGELDRA